MPPPMQRAATPLCPALPARVWRRVTRILQPLAPMGWPRAMAPPPTFTCETSTISHTSLHPGARDLVRVDSQFLHHCQRLSCKCFVQLKHINISHTPASLLQLKRNQTEVGREREERKLKKTDYFPDGRDGSQTHN